MNIWQKKHNQAGDTIVEVLIAVAVVSSVLSGAFLVAQKSTKAVRDSQEHAEMAQILQGQVELVRALALKETSTTSGVYDTSPKYFCIDTTTRKRANLGFSGSLPALDADTFNPAEYTAACQVGTDNRYNIAITYDAVTTSPGVFRFTGRWDRVGGGRNQEQLSYRVYPGAVAP